MYVLQWVEDKNGIRPEQSVHLFRREQDAIESLSKSYSTIEGIVGIKEFKYRKEIKMGNGDKYLLLEPEIIQDVVQL